MRGRRESKGMTERKSEREKEKGIRSNGGNKKLCMKNVLAGSRRNQGTKLRE